MDIIGGQISKCTDIVHELLSILRIQPESYLFLFPSGKDADTVRQLVADGVFPTIPALAPAITYAIVLSVLRFTMSHAVLKVSICCNTFSSVLSKINPQFIDEMIHVDFIFFIQRVAKYCLKISMIPQPKNREIETEFPKGLKKEEV